MSRGVSGGTFALAVLAVSAGTLLIWLAGWTAPLVAAENAVLDGRLSDGLSEYRRAEERLSQIPALQQVAPAIVAAVQANQIRLLYHMGLHDEAIEKAGTSARSHAAHFWAGCALFTRATNEERPDARLEWFERAEAEFRAALALSPADWDTKYNYELTRSLLTRLRDEPQTPRRLLFELLRPQTPRSGGTAPPRRTG
jgi:hypothetical protein